MPESARRIILRTNPHENFAEISVRDFGPGFGENLDHVFESFYTTKPDGMGMGLPICATLIHSHRGQLYVNDHPDGGAIVSFKLPLLE